MAWLLLAVALALALDWLLPGSGSCLALEKSTSPGSPCPVSLESTVTPPDCWQAPRPPGPFWLQSPLYPLHPTRSAHPIAYYYQHACLLQPLRPHPLSLRCRHSQMRCTARYVHACPRRSSQERAMGTDRPRWAVRTCGRHALALSQLHAHTPPPPHFDAKYIARSLAGLHQP